MPASRVRQLINSARSVADIVTGGNVRARAFYPSFRPCQVFQSAASVAVGSGGFTKVTFDKVSFDPTRSWSTANSQAVIPVPGMYSFCGAVSCNTNANAGAVIVSLFINGGEIFRGMQWAFLAGSAGSYAMPFSFNVTVVHTGDVVDIRVFQNSGANISLVGSAGAPVFTWLTVNMLGGL